jgi:hypothetical protein
LWVYRLLGQCIQDISYGLSAQGLQQTSKYSNKILDALDSEVVVLEEVIASQHAQQKKLDLLFEELEKLNQATKAGGANEASREEASVLVDQFAKELEIDRAEVRGALEEMELHVGTELGSMLDALGSLSAQVSGLLIAESIHSTG